MQQSAINNFIRPVADCIGDGKFLTWEQYDSLKGVLIILIVVGHNTHLQSVWPNLDRVIYNFHVSSFLLIPQLLGAGAFTLVAMRDKTIRFMVPHIFFLTAATILYAVFIKQGLTVEDYVANWTRALLYGNSPNIAEAAGLQLYWFLPTLLTMTVIRACYYNMPFPVALVMFLAIVGTALFIGTAGSVYVKKLPWGLAIAAYMLTAGFVTVHLVNLLTRLKHELLILAILSLTLVALSWVSVYVTNTRLNLSIGRYFSIAQPGPFLVHFALVVTGMLTALYATRFLDFLRIFRNFGRYSLVIFLTHSMVFYGINFIGPYGNINFFNLPGGILSLTLTTAISTSIAIVIAKTEILRRLVTPRSYDDWKFARR